MASDLTERRAALRALLVEHAEASAPRRGARPRDAEPGRFRMAVVTGAVAVAVVGATVVALQLPGAHAFLAGPASTATASPTPSVTSDAPTPTTPPTTAPPVADPTPTNAPTSDAPVPTRTPTSTPAATSTPPAALVAPTGFQRITRAQLHAFVVEQGNDAVWEEQQWIIIGCMADHGFVYDTIQDFHDPLGWRNGLTAAQQQAYDEAMYGPPRSGAYDWRTAGCDGLAVHETGQDETH